MTAKWSGARPGSRVLDVCCGSGDIAMLLARLVGPTGQVSRAQGGARHAPNRKTLNPKPYTWGCNRSTSMCVCV